MSVILAKQKHPELFSMVVWTIWHQRNNIRLGKQVLLPSQILEQAREKLQEFSSFHNPTLPPTATPASCWRPPNHNYVKINFDGALFSKENRAGIGVVIPTKQGWSWLHFHSKYLYPQQYWRWRHLLHEFAVEIGVNRVRGGARNFCLGGPSATLIHLLRQLPHTHIYIYTHTCAFLLYIHTFYLINYIYTHKKKRSLVFSIKIICDGDLS